MQVQAVPGDVCLEDGCAVSSQDPESEVPGEPCGDPWGLAPRALHPGLPRALGHFLSIVPLEVVLSTLDLGLHILRES